MFCRNCGNELAVENAAICVKCGVSVGDGDKFCPTCGNEVNPGAAVCLKCGVSLLKKNADAANAKAGTSSKSKLTAGLLGLLLGGWGAHNFYLGNSSKAVIQIIVSIFTCGLGSLWGVIEGIMILCGKIHTDASGAELAN